MTNISDLCYDFIEHNLHIFDVKQYDNDHSLNVDLLDKYVRNQTCSNKYFDLIQYIYRHSTYIDADIFIQKYRENVMEIIRNNSDKEIIVLFPYLETTKSNFFLTLYFLHLFNEISLSKINMVFAFEINNYKKHVIDTRTLTKEPLFVICDDFVYSGNQLALSIANLPIVCNSQVSIYLCISGMTRVSMKKFSTEYLKSILTPYEYDKDDNEIPPVATCFYNVIIPTHAIIIVETLKSVVLQKLTNEGLFTGNDVYDFYNYIRLNDMYILTVEHGKLYAVGQFNLIYYNANNTLIYLFFKYPDLISIILRMCVLYQYTNKYTVLLDSLIPSNVPIKYPKNDSSYLNKFEITQDLFSSEQDLLELKENIKQNAPVNLEKFTWLQKCEDVQFTENDNVKIVNSNNIELIRNLKREFNPAHGSVCNNSIETFYKEPKLIRLFNKLRDIIKSILPLAKGIRKINKRTNKRPITKRNRVIKKTRRRNYKK